MTAAHARLLGVAATMLAVVAAWPLDVWRVAVVLVATLLAGLAGVLLREATDREPS